MSRLHNLKTLSYLLVFKTIISNNIYVLLILCTYIKVIHLDQNPRWRDLGNGHIHVHFIPRSYTNLETPGWG